MPTKDKIDAAECEVNGNYDYYQQMLPEWRDAHLNEHALMHHQELMGFYESMRDAIQVGIKYYGLGNFSVQSIEDIPVDFGHQSNALFHHSREGGNPGDERGGVAVRFF